MTIQELYEWANENGALNENVCVHDIYEGWKYAEGVEKNERHGAVEVRIW